MEARGNRALFLMDLGMPRNIEAAAAELYNVYLYNLDDLSAIVAQNRQAREGEVPRAEAIIEDHVAQVSFLAGQRRTCRLRHRSPRASSRRPHRVPPRAARVSHASHAERSRTHRNP